jgi:hypothetical protein
MTVMQLTSPNLSPQPTPGDTNTAVKRDDERSGVLPADGRATVAAHFRPLDLDIVNDTIPAFFIGRNKDGFWVARDAKGKSGGIFLTENSALAFARNNSEPAGCVTIFPSERFELDLENKGNPLVPWIAPFARLAMRARRRMAGLIGG